MMSPANSSPRLASSNSQAVVGLTAPSSPDYIRRSETRKQWQSTRLSYLRNPDAQPCPSLNLAQPMVATSFSKHTDCTITSRFWEDEQRQKSLLKACLALRWTFPGFDAVWLSTVTCLNTRAECRDGPCWFRITSVCKLSHSLDWTTQE